MSSDSKLDSPTSRPTRVLVVEDEAEVINVLAELLTRHGYEVVPARNGVAAMVALTAPEPENPHLVLLDLGLPLESGADVLSFLRNIMRSGIPVVVLTGSTDTDLEKSVRSLGVSDYLRKPASPHHILSALSAARSISP